VNKREVEASHNLIARNSKGTQKTLAIDYQDRTKAKMERRSNA
jgi:hypothetical protein